MDEILGLDEIGNLIDIKVSLSDDPSIVIDAFDVISQMKNIADAYKNGETTPYGDH